MNQETIYRVSFISQGEVYEIYARHVSQGGLFGFVEIEELVFGERSKLLIDSSEERLKTEFEGVRRYSESTRWRRRAAAASPLGRARSRPFRWPSCRPARRATAEMQTRIEPIPMKPHVHRTRTHCEG